MTFIRELSGWLVFVLLLLSITVGTGNILFVVFAVCMTFLILVLNVGVAILYRNGKINEH